MSKQDRFETTSLILLVILIGWTIYTAYLSPHLLFNWRYDVPVWIWQVRIWLVEQFGVSERQGSLIIIGIMILIAGLLFLIEKLLTKDNKRLPKALEEIELRKKRQKALRAEIKNTTNFFMLIIIIAIAVFVVLLGFHWLISIV